MAALALLFVAIDIRTTPESPVLKWGFVLLTAYTGVIDAFLYVLGGREPLPGLHERYVAARWRQGAAMHSAKSAPAAKHHRRRVGEPRLGWGSHPRRRPNPNKAKLVGISRR